MGVNIVGLHCEKGMASSFGVDIGLRSQAFDQYILLNGGLQTARKFNGIIRRARWSGALVRGVWNKIILRLSP